jgi:hypothetical protein
MADPDLFAPKGKIARARAALLSFAPDCKPRISAFVARGRQNERVEVPSLSISITLKPRAPLDETIENIARSYNENASRWEIQARLSGTLDALEGLGYAANSFVAALSAVMGDDVALGNLLRDAMLRAENERNRGFECAVTGEVINPPALPFDDVTDAFLPEILSREFWPNAAFFIQPSIDRAQAIARLATRARKGLAGVGPDKGGPEKGLARLGVPPPRNELVTACAWLIVDCFGAEAVKRISRTLRPRREALRERTNFEEVVAELHRYAVGAEAPANFFVNAMKKALPDFRRNWAKFKDLPGVKRRRDL